ncbi:MAG TPA: ABC transporter substrate-binding protein [Chloroflexota bacterium]|jgi:NitT/TauT family transport system substrate-binding protein|nr:ABC transporter substrate-binding protein [Chloroflexota bacterium]
MSRLGFIGLLLLISLSAACGPSTSTAPPTAAPTAAPTSAAKPAAPIPTAPTASARPTTAAAAPTQAATGYNPTPLNPPVKVTIGLLASSSDGGILIANDRGYFKQEGIDLDIQRFQTLVDMVAPLSTGQLQIAAGGLAASLYNAANRELGMRIVADKGSTPSPEWDYSGLVIRKDLIDSGRVKDFSDLKGLTLAISGRGNSPEVSLATALKKGGLALKDINYTNMGFPDMVTALSTKGIDGGIVIEPFLSRVVSEGTGVKFKSTLDILGGNQQIAVIVYGDEFAKNKDVAQHWMNAYIRGLRDYNDAFGPKKKGYDQAVKTLVENTTVKDPKVYDQMKPAGLDPDGKLDIRSMQDDLNYYTDSGQVQGQVDLNKLIDTSFQENAVKLLGPYQK